MEWGYSAFQHQLVRSLASRSTASAQKRPLTFLYSKVNGKVVKKDSDLSDNNYDWVVDAKAQDVIVFTVADSKKAKLSGSEITVEAAKTTTKASKTSTKATTTTLSQTKTGSKTKSSISAKSTAADKGSTTTSKPTKTSSGEGGYSGSGDYVAQG